MWRLIIWQKCKCGYEIGGNKQEYEVERDVSFESEDITDLFVVIESMSKVYATDITRYEIRKVVD